MVSKLKKPRRILLLVKAGQAVDDFIDKLVNVTMNRQSSFALSPSQSDQVTHFFPFIVGSSSWTWWHYHWWWKFRVQRYNGEFDNPNLWSYEVITLFDLNVYAHHIQRRCKSLKEKNLLFVGSGVSGGEDGARYGPSLMPGGHKDAWWGQACIKQVHLCICVCIYWHLWNPIFTLFLQATHKRYFSEHCRQGGHRRAVLRLGKY